MKIIQHIATLLKGLIGSPLGGRPVEIVMQEEDRVLDDLDGDLSGNQAMRRLHGRGSHPCEKVRQRGHDTTFVCE